MLLFHTNVEIISFEHQVLRSIKSLNATELKPSSFYLLIKKTIPIVLQLSCSAHLPYGKVRGI